MSRLIKRKDHCSLQYCDPSRSPRRKQLALRTTNRKTALQIQIRLDDLHARGLFDPWYDDPQAVLSNPDPEKQAPRWRRGVRLEEAVRAFLASRRHLSPKRG